MSLRPHYWETVPLSDMTHEEWEALCDGCGTCCLNKIEDDDTGEVFLTRVACRLLDNDSCRCTQYETRKSIVPECITLTPKTIEKHAYWLPKTCAYYRLYKGEALPEWHPLISGNPNGAHEAGIGYRGQTVSEAGVDDYDWEDHILQDS